MEGSVLSVLSIDYFDYCSVGEILKYSICFDLYYQVLRNCIAQYTVGHIARVAAARALIRQGICPFLLNLGQL